MLVAAGIAIGVSAGCEASAAPVVHRIVVEEMKFTPPARQLRAGDTILWVNKGILRHSATSRDGRYNVDLPPRTSRTTLLSRPGKVSIYCIYHPGMKVTLDVAK